jgi:pimeloyl-ACP methyl ester carboxylesterase
MLAVLDLSNLANPDAWLGLGLLLGLGALVYFGALSLFTLHRLRHPHRRSYAYAVARGIAGDPSELAGDAPAFEAWSFTHDGRTFEAWDVHAGDAEGPVVVVSHGWGSSRIDMLSRFAALRPHASRVIFWDMRAHGETPGPCTLGVREAGDLVAMLDRLLEDPGAASRGLVLYGYSLGAEVTLRAFERLDGRARAAVREVVLESPYRHGITPARGVLRASGFPRRVNLPIAMALHALLNGQRISDRWRDLAPLAEPLADAGARLLVIHGAEDSISPPADGEAFANAGGGTLALVSSAGHKDLFEHGETDTRPAIAEALASFFARSG